MNYCRFTGAGALVLAVYAGVCATPALARNRPRSFEFGVFGGQVNYDTPILFFAGSSGDSGVLGGTRGAEFFGARLGYNLTPHWEIELTHDDSSTEDSRFKQAKRDYVTEQLTVNYNFLTTTERRLYPYATGGLGRLANKITVASKSHEDSSIALVLGGGFRLFFNKSIALRVDGRWKTYNAKFDIPDPDGSNPANSVPPILIDDTFSDFEVTIGLHGIMGGKK